MWQYIGELVKVLGTATVIVAAITWLAKSLITHVLSRNIEIYKVELKRESDKEVERLRSNLQIAAQERQIVFNKLHEQRALVIVESYKLLNDALQNFNYYYFSSITMAPIESFGEDSGAKCLELRDYFGDNRIFFSPELCSMMDDFTSTVTKTVGSYVPTGSPEKDQAALREYREELEDLCTGTMPDLLVALENEFRAILGVITVPSS